MKKKIFSILAVMLAAFGNTTLAQVTLTSELDLSNVKYRDMILSNPDDESSFYTQYTKTFGLNSAITLTMTANEDDGLNAAADEGSDDGVSFTFSNGPATISVTANTSQKCPITIQSITFTFAEDESPYDFSDNVTSNVSIKHNENGTSTYEYSLGDENPITMTFEDGEEEDWIGLVKINVTYTVNGSIDFHDKAEYYIQKETGITDFNYIRRYYGCWQSLYVPFSLDIENLSADYEFAEISSINENGMYVSKLTSGSTTPNTPYLIKKKSVSDKNNGDQATIQVSSKFAAAANTEVNYGDYTITGTYTTYNDCVGRDKAENPYTVIAQYNTSKKDNTSILERADGSSNCAIPAQRWYMVSNGSSAKLAINVIGEDDITTGISRIKSSSSIDDYFYNLAGQGVKANSKGFIIKNGKKYFNK